MLQSQICVINILNLIQGYYYSNNYIPGGTRMDQMGNDIAIIRIANVSSQPLVSMAQNDPSIDTSITAIGWGVNEQYGNTGWQNLDLSYTAMATSTTACPRMPPGVICGSELLIYLFFLLSVFSFYILHLFVIIPSSIYHEKRSCFTQQFRGLFKHLPR